MRKVVAKETFRHVTMFAAAAGGCVVAVVEMWMVGD